MLSDLHVHTTWSDGKHTAEEMISAAVEKGYSAFGISDHSHSVFDSSYCMNREKYPAYQRRIAELKREYEGRIAVFCGLERDWFSTPAEGFDYVIGSVHYVLCQGEYYSVDGSAACQERFFREIAGGDRLELARRYYDTVMASVQKAEFQIMGHFDLVRKYGFFDGLEEQMEDMEREAMLEVIKNVPFLEVNLGGIFRRVRREPYPCLSLLSFAAERGARIVIGGDMHCREAVGFYQDEIRPLLRKTGFTHSYHLSETGFVPIAL